MLKVDFLVVSEFPGQADFFITPFTCCWNVSAW
jgi:hypothetical protein